MAITLLEKLDSSCRNHSLQESICDQIQRVISTRTYLGLNSADNTCVTGFGVPEIVDQYRANEEQQKHYCGIIRQQILLLEPRVNEVEVKSISSDGSCGKCHLTITIGKETFTEKFSF